MVAMDYETFRASLEGDAPPTSASGPLQALWHEARGDWDTAHQCAQDAKSPEGAWVHAYLHRVEGDLSNAGYWYRRAGKPRHEGQLADEWGELVRALL